MPSFVSTAEAWWSSSRTDSTGARRSRRWSGRRLPGRGSPAGDRPARPGRSASRSWGRASPAGPLPCACLLVCDTATLRAAHSGRDALPEDIDAADLPDIADLGAGAHPRLPRDTEAAAAAPAWGRGVSRGAGREARPGAVGVNGAGGRARAARTVRSGAPGRSAGRGPPGRDGGSTPLRCGARGGRTGSRTGSRACQRCSGRRAAGPGVGDLSPSKVPSTVVSNSVKSSCHTWFWPVGSVANAAFRRAVRSQEIGLPESLTRDMRTPPLENISLVPVRRGSCTRLLSEGSSPWGALRLTTRLDLT
jgi:hypothetical protein